MINQEDIVQRISSFTKKGEDLRNSFAERFGGGGFAGTSKVAETFKNDTGDMVNKVVETDTKTINDMISSALADKVKEEVKKEEPTYTRKNETVVDAEMSPNQLEDFLSKMLQNEETVRKASTGVKLAEDSGIKNAAAALQTTQNVMMEGLDFSNLNPDIMQSIIDSNKDLQKVEVTTKDYTPEITQTTEPTQILSTQIEEPAIESTMTPATMDLSNLDGIGQIDPAVLAALVAAQTQTEEPSKEVEPTPPNVSEKFSNLVDTVFDTNQETPESYKLSSIKATYTKVEKKDGAEQPTPTTLDNEELDSIDVVGSVVDDLADEDLASIDVIGEEDVPEETLSSIDVIGEEDMEDEDLGSIDVVGEEDMEDEYLKSIDVVGEEDDITPDKEEQETYSFGDNPWERFKELYLDFYTGGQGAEALKDFNQRTVAGEFPELAGTFQSSKGSTYKEYQSVSPVFQKTNDILRMNGEKSQMDDMMTSMRSVADNKTATPTIINNSRTIVAKAPEDSKTGRVFSDDNTFNRLSAADSNHPQYYGFRI